MPKGNQHGRHSPPRNKAPENKGAYKKSAPKFRPKNNKTNSTQSKNTGAAIEGPIRVSKYGSGFIDTENGETIRIETADLNTALHGDIVIVSQHPGRRGKDIFGYVTKVVKRARENFVGTITHDHPTDTYSIKPDDHRFYTNILIVGSHKPSIGHKALVELSPWTDPRKSPEGRLIQILGPAGEHETEMLATSLSKGFSATFPVEVEKEAKEHERNFVETVQKELGFRRDFRSVPTCTIDPVDAKDFDDALSVRILPNGNTEVGIHIADVSFFVKPGTALEKEAARRATSVYLVDRTIPMLPEALSNNICSLIPNEERLAYSAVVELDKDAHVKNQWFGRTVIRSQKRFSYEEAFKVITEKQGPFAENLEILNRLAKILRKRRIEHGSVMFDKPEVKIVLDENKHVSGVKIKELTDSNHLVEEFMLLANKRVAEHIGKQPKFKGFVYRIHDLPDRERIELLGVFLRGIGYDFGGGKSRVTARDINVLFSAISGKDEESLIQTATLRSMAKAIYSTRNIGHFGLGFEYYTHFTSPIRRYPDVLVHRLLEKHLTGTPLAGQELALLEQACKHSSEREKEAAEAERDSIRFKQLEYMSTKVGETYEGIISGMTDWGMFVEDKETKCEGMIKLANMPDDYYEFNEKTYSLTGSRTKKKYRLGDPLKVRIARVDVGAREMDLEIVK